MKRFIHYLKLTALVIVVGVLFSSCVSQKNILYMQNLANEKGVSDYQGSRDINYKVQEGDNLYIKVVSENNRDITTQMFNPNATTTVSQNDAGIYLNSYTVNEEGYIIFPLIGECMVKNKTVEEIRKELQGKVSKFLKQTVVILKLVNFNVTILGEVNQPREYKVYQENINIFEAIALAGDLTDYANRKDVKLIRQTKSGSQVITLNLTKADILSSDYYYLQPNDIVYIEPLRSKQFAFTSFPYAVIFSAISTTVLILGYLKK
ncbi:MAG: polysaccharide biosynthesis/export family protein [Bacteroidales bacterium]